MAQDNSLHAVGKKSNPKFAGLATAKQIAENPNLFLVDKNHLAIEKVVEAKAVIEEKKEADLNPGVPSEAVKPADIRRRPAAPAQS